MTKTLGLPLLALIMALLPVAHAGNNPFPKQPKINDAYQQLTAAAAQVNLAKKDAPARHLEKAGAKLSAAKANLESAKKNKGSARPSAIKLIELAQTEIAAAPGDIAHLDKAAELIAQALEKVTQAGENGR